jgi:tripartite-type tricarboxylate transporter receptor subunit TctC
MSLNRFFAAATVAAATFAFASAANAQGAGNYPNKPIKLIVPASAGGSADAVGRAMADELAKVLKQPIVVENIASAASIAGTNYVAQSEPDGYTMLISSASIVILPALRTDIPYVAERDLTPVTQINTSGHVLVVSAKSPYKTAGDLVTALKAGKPGQYNYGSSGVGSTPHLMVELFMASTGVSMTHIPYKSSGETALAILKDEVLTTVDAMPAVLPHIQSGNMRALGVATGTRAPELPDVPTLHDQYASFPPTQLWLGIFVRAGTPKPIIDKLSASIKEAVNSPDGVKKLANTGSRPVGSTPEQFGELVKTDAKVWADLIKTKGIKAE